MDYGACAAAADGADGAPLALVGAVLHWLSVIFETGSTISWFIQQDL